MARGRAVYQRGRVVATEGGGWEIHNNVYLTDPTTGKPKRHHRSRVVGYKPKMTGATPRRSCLRNWPPSTMVRSPERQTGPSHLAMRGASWRDATRRTNLDYLDSHVNPTLEHVALRDVSKFQVQMLLNRLATEEYSYAVVYHVRDLIKAALAEAVDQGAKCRAQDRHSRDRGVRQAGFFLSRCTPSCWPVLTASVTAPSS